VARRLSQSRYLLNDTSNINVDSVIIELKIPAVVYSLSRALIYQIPLMIELKYIFSFLSFYLSLCHAFSSRSLPSYIDRESRKWVVRKRTHLFMALHRVHNDDCTVQTEITNSPVWGICSLAERLLIFPKGVVRYCSWLVEWVCYSLLKQIAVLVRSFSKDALRHW